MVLIQLLLPIDVGDTRERGEMPPTLRPAGHSRGTPLRWRHRPTPRPQ